jgi:hypothetical protein
MLVVKVLKQKVPISRQQTLKCKTAIPVQVDKVFFKESHSKT